jgi:hypothetical protein
LDKIEIKKKLLELKEKKLRKLEDKGPVEVKIYSKADIVNRLLFYNIEYMEIIGYWEIVYNYSLNLNTLIEMPSNFVDTISVVNYVNNLPIPEKELFVYLADLEIVNYYKYEIYNLKELKKIAKKGETIEKLNKKIQMFESKIK